MTRRSKNEPNPPGFTPAQIVDIEIGSPLPAVVAEVNGGGGRYRRALALVRLHRHPLGMLDLALPDGGLDPGCLAVEVWSGLATQIAAHLADDGLPEVSSLAANGLPAEGARCRQGLDPADAALVSVVVPTRDRTERLVACVDSLLAMTYPHFEIVVVDNAPNNAATAEAVGCRYGGDARVRYVREERAGVSLARNRGFAAAGGDIVAFTDDDVVVDPEWLSALVRPFGVVADVSCVTGLVLPAEIETPAQLWFEQYGGFEKGYHRQIFDLGEHRAPGPLYPYATGVFGSGNSMAFRRHALEAVGGFDPALGAGTVARNGDETEVFLKTVLANGRIVYEPAAVVRHFHRREYAALQTQLFNYGVGLSAVFTKCVKEDPAMIGRLLRRAVPGLVFLLDPRSPKNAKKRDGFPRDLARRELQGLLYGPLAYARSARQVGRASSPPSQVTGPTRS